jgi:AcrR family transcriptional regulator
LAKRETGRRRGAAPRRSREQLVEDIVQAATEGFATGGKDATARAIAARARVQPSVIFRYFGSMQALLGEVVARGARRDAEIVSRYLGGPPPDLLAAMLGGNLAFRAALLRGVQSGLRANDVPGGVASVELVVSGLMRGSYTPIRPGERFDPRVVAAFLAAATVGWQATGDFFVDAADLGGVDRGQVEAAVGWLFDQIYALADPAQRLGTR